MRRFLFALVALCLPMSALAQQQLSTYDSYDAYKEQVTTMLSEGRAIDLLGQLTDFSQMTVAQRSQAETQMSQTWSTDGYPNFSQVMREEFGDFSREIWAFWTDANQYNFVFTYLHELPDGTLRVLHLGFGSQINQIFQSF